MGTQVPDQQEQPWHAKFGLDEFVEHVEKLQKIVDSANSTKLWSIDKMKLKKMVGWGLFVEEVVESLDTKWQRDALARALSSLHFATLSRLQQARRWVLGSVLGSTFLAGHPQPEALCVWTIGEFAELRTSQGFDDVEHKRWLGVVGALVDDVGGVVKSRGDVGILSHTYSALLLCRGWRRLALVDCDGGAAGDGGTRQRAPSERAPSVYEMSVETAQKRAYASTCYNMLSDLDDGGHPEACLLGERATSFIEELTELARTDSLVLEILCLMLLEPRERTSFTSEPRMKTSVRGPHSESQLDDSLQSPLKSTLLRQVLRFRNDTRLWSFDTWLLREVSCRYEAFAEAYLGEVLRKEVDDGILPSASATWVSS